LKPDKSYLSDTMLCYYAFPDVNKYYESLKNMVRIDVENLPNGGFNYHTQLLNNEDCQTPISFLNIKDNYVSFFLDNYIYIINFFDYFQKGILNSGQNTSVVKYMAEVIKIATESIKDSHMAFLSVYGNEPVLIGTFGTWPDSLFHLKKEVKYTFKTKFQEVEDDEKRYYQKRMLESIKFSFDAIH
jgi:hypothetical protein